MKIPDVRTLSHKSSHERPWFYFDQNFYLAQCLENGVSAPLGAPEIYLRHYLDRGANAGFSPNPLFDEGFYRRQYPEIAREIQLGHWSSGFDHFLRVGAAADFSPTWFFDGPFYKKLHSDLTNDALRSGGFLDRYAHYLLIGVTEARPAHWIGSALQKIKEQRDFPTDRAELCMLVTDRNRTAEVFAPVFDYEWMKEKYHWGRSISPANFVRHYLLNVTSEHLSPSPYFDEAFYLSAEPEVRAAVEQGVFASGFEHFLLLGMNEWRQPFAAFDPHYYYQTNMAGETMGASLQSPFTHFLRHRVTRRLALSRPLGMRDIPEDMGKGVYERRCVLTAGRLGDLRFTPDGIEPAVSILIVARDNFAQTANCIVSAAYNTRARIEVVLFDNGSTDAVRDVPTINPAIKYIRSETNIGFTVAVNRAAEMATGRVILLLNNDTELTPGAIDIALQTLEADRSIGAVGAKIVRMHGRLQEGGSIVWRDGSCLGYGRDHDPTEGQNSFVQDVDFCSGCFLAIRRAVWEDLGGFDTNFAPAYYEETDFCLRLWECGRRVVYDPRIVVWHFEFGSSANPEEPLALMRRNQRYFVSKHRAFLSQCLPPATANIERARLRHIARPRVLFIEDKVPDPTKGMGYVRSGAVAEILGRACGLVSVLGLHNTKWPTTLPHDSDGRRIEILTDVNLHKVQEFIRSRIGVYDLIWLSRTHNLPRLREWRTACPEFFANLPIVLDTEAMAAPRRFAYAQQSGQPADLAEMLRDEMDDLDGISHICVVNELDRNLVRDILVRREIAIPVSMLGHAIRVQPVLPKFSQTRDIVLAGSYSQLDGPNADGLLWFDREVRPLIGELPGLEFVIAGSEAARFAEAAGLQHDYRVVNDPVSMGQVYQNARLMVAPTRFSGGIPMKVHEAASYGVPVVMTDILARQLGWQQDGIVATPAVPEQMATAIELLTSDRTAWVQTQALQLALVAVDCDPAVFEARIQRILADPEASTDKVPRAAE